jgi:hypothetical protein
MPGQSGGIGHQYVVSDEAVVSDVCLGHQEAIVAESRDAATALCPAMNGHKLANAIAATDLRLRRLTSKLQILWRLSYRHEGIEMSLVADARPAVDYAMTINPDAIAKNHLVTDDYVRTDYTFASQLSAGTDNCGRMNLLGAILD